MVETLLRAILAFCLMLLPAFGAAHGQTPTPEEPTCDASLSAAYYVGLGDAYFAAKDYTHAIESHTCALQADPSFAPAFAARGYARAVQGDEPGALEDFNRAVELDEALIPAYVNRGVLYAREGNFALALNDLTLALALDPQNVSALQNRAIVHAAEGSYDDALADLEAAIGLAPDDPGPHAALGAVYLALAAKSYNEFRALAGESVPAPGDAPPSLYLSLERSTITGTFGEWLAFLRPAE